jgi:hypothetical protein
MLTRIIGTQMALHIVGIQIEDDGQLAAPVLPRRGAATVSGRRGAQLGQWVVGAATARPAHGPLLDVRIQVPCIAFPSSLQSQHGQDNKDNKSHVLSLSICFKYSKTTHDSNTAAAQTESAFHGTLENTIKLT